MTYSADTEEGITMTVEKFESLCKIRKAFDLLFEFISLVRSFSKDEFDLAINALEKELRDEENNNDT